MPCLQPPLPLQSTKLYASFKNLLLEYGANPNALGRINNKEVSPLEHAIKSGNDGIADILLEFGASCLHLKLSTQKHSHLLKKIVFVPAKSHLVSSVKKIRTALLCFKRLCPKLPKDVRYLILNMIETDDLGHYMITRKLTGLPIPHLFLKAASNVLLTCTMTHLKKKYKILNGSLIQNEIKENIRKRLAKEKLFCNNPWHIKE